MEDKGKILVIDDELVMCNLLQDFLSDKGYEVTARQSGEKGLEEFSKGKFDLTIVDIRMPGIGGMGVLEEVKKSDSDAVVIVITAFGSLESVQKAVRLGAYDYITKPFNIEQILFAVKRAIDARRLIVANKELMENLEKQNIVLEEKADKRGRELAATHKKLQDVYMRTITALASAIDAKDNYTRSHSEHVTKYAVAIAKEIGLSRSETELVREACQLHDIGKIGVHDYILTKPDKLTPEERNEVELHALLGAEILKPLVFLDGVIELVKQHHERCDGKGYPNGTKKADIKMGARIMAVADAFDAMLSERPYRKALSKKKAIAELKKYSGSQFDPQVVKALLKVLEKQPDITANSE